MRLPYPALALLALTFTAAAQAHRVCELGGQAIDPDNGAALAGKSGLMRCRDSDSGAMLREQEVRDGRFVGLLRQYRDGMPVREITVDERGRQQGLAREWQPDANGRPVLRSEAQLVDGRLVGVQKSWHANGQLQRLGFIGPDEQVRASVEFTDGGRLAALRCASTPVFGPLFDDKAACGHEGRPSTVLLYAGAGPAVSRLTLERGIPLKVETLWPDGAAREQTEALAGGGSVERRFTADGVKLYEKQWVVAAAQQRRLPLLEQEFHASGRLLHERRWQGLELLSDARWYQNGQAQSRSEYATDAGGRRVAHRREWFDNGKLRSEGDWLVSEGASYEAPIGTQRTYDERGQLRTESVYDARGRITREREYAGTGALLRDDEVFEDGSRKSFVVKAGSG